MKLTQGKLSVNDICLSNEYKRTSEDKLRKDHKHVEIMWLCNSSFDYNETFHYLHYLDYAENNCKLNNKFSKKKMRNLPLISIINDTKVIKCIIKDYFNAFR